MFTSVKFALFSAQRICVLFCFVSSCNCYYMQNQHTLFVHLYAYVNDNYILQLNNIIQTRPLPNATLTISK